FAPCPPGVLATPPREPGRPGRKNGNPPRICPGNIGQVYSILPLSRSAGSGACGGSPCPRSSHRRAAMSTPPPADPPIYVRPLSEVAPRPVAWLWPGRLALGKLALLDGDP